MAWVKIDKLKGADGSTGSSGTAATIAVGTVTTGLAGSSAAVTNAGSSSSATLNFAIPRGDVGATGAAGTTDYNNLLNRPVIPAAQVQSDWTEATSGAIDFIKNKPTLGTAAAQNTSAFDASGVASSLVNTEASTRSSADTSEASSRASGDSTNASAITAEASARASADSTLTTSVNTKAPSSRAINTTAPLTGGGDLSADRTLSIAASTTSVAGSMSSADKTKLDSMTIIGGYPAMTVTSVSNTYTALVTDELILCDTSSIAFTVTLPTAIGITGKEYTVKCTGNKTLTMATTSGQTFDGSGTTKSITANNGSINCVSDGANWRII